MKGRIYKLVNEKKVEQIINMQTFKEKYELIKILI